MLIITEDFGQHSNRLYALAPFLAYCNQYKIKIFCFSFGKYAKNYPHHNSSKYCKFINLQPTALTLIRKFLTYFSRSTFLSKIQSVVAFDSLNKNPLTTDDFQKKICLLDPWHHPKPPISEDGLLFLRATFAPEQQIITAVTTFLKDINPNDKPLLGIHARRGDYRYFKNGKWFYSEDEYLQIIQSASTAVHFITGVLPITVVVSDEHGFLAQGEWHRSPFKSIFADQWLLSCSHFIVGPPSTFSHWAAFIGQSLIAFASKSTAKIQPDDFTPPPRNFHTHHYLSDS